MKRGTGINDIDTRGISMREINLRGTSQRGLSEKRLIVRGKMSRESDFVEKNRHPDTVAMEPIEGSGIGGGCSGGIGQAGGGGSQAGSDARAKKTKRRGSLTARLLIDHTAT